MPNFKVTYTTDPTGMSNDEKILLSIKKDICLFDIHDNRNRFRKVIHDEICKIDQKAEYYLTIWKVYTT